MVGSRSTLSRRQFLTAAVGGTGGTGVLAALTGDPRRETTQPAPSPGGQLRVGAGEASLAWRAGAKPGQVGTGGGTSVTRRPYPYTTTAAPSDGFQSEPTAKVVVLESDGKRHALVKVDAYLFHEQVHRRIADLVAPLEIPRERLIVSATHNHSVPHAFATGLAVGLFADGFDPRHWSYVSRQVATAIERAVDSLQPATVRAVESSFDRVQENIIGESTVTEKATADVEPFDHGAPAEHPPLTDDGGRQLAAGFPADHFEDQLVLLRFDTPDGSPIAATITLGMHPESLEGGHGLISADFVGPVERALERHVGGDFLAAYLMGPLGDIEPSRGGVGRPNWWRQTFGRLEEMATEIGEEVIEVYERAGEAPIPDDDGGLVGDRTDRVTGRTTPPATVGEPTVLAHGRAVDVETASVRLPPPSGWPGPSMSYLSQTVGSGGALPSTMLAQESVSPLLAAIRIGDILLATHPGEPISDVSFNFRTRVQTGFEEVYQGYHWPENPEWIRARILENFRETRVEEGYDIAAMLSLGNAWTGYYVTRWEYENRNHYRQRLTPYGPESAEHVNGTLVALARELRGEGTVTTRSSMTERIDGTRRTGVYAALVAADESAVPAHKALIVPDTGDVGKPRAQPTETRRFEEATFTWAGGTNAVDVPVVALERRDGDGWTRVTDSRGHAIVVTTEHPSLLSRESLASSRDWTAHWEVPWDAPEGVYRFAVGGSYRGVPGSGTRSDLDPLGADGEYTVISEPFSVVGGAIPYSERYSTVSVEGDRLTGQLGFEPERRAFDRPDAGDTIPVTLSGDRTIETTATYGVEGFEFEVERPGTPAKLVVERGAFTDAMGNPNEQVDLELDETDLNE